MNTVAVPARVGLVGNPSDGYGGAVLATVVPSLAATVRAVADDGVVVVSARGELRWGTIEHLRADVESRGHPAEQRIITAALVTLARHLRDVATGIRIEWSTSIPRSVGLAGSSALAIGIVRAVSEAWGRTLDPRVVAALALSAEVDELGVAAGWQDRAVQSYGGTVLVDTAMMDIVDGWRVPTVRNLRVAASESMVVGWLAESAEDSGGYHGALRQRGDVASGMATLAGLARNAATAVEAGDLDALAAAMESTWQVRQHLAPLTPAHTRLVEAVRSTGVAATTPGSGGSVVALPTDDGARQRVTDVLDRLGATSCLVPLRS